MTLAAHAVTVSYGPRRVLEDVSLEVRPGEWVAVIGPNGAGKSTLMAALLGLLEPATGSVLLDGRPVSEWPRPELARRLAYVPQRLAAMPPFTIEALVVQGRTPRREGFLFESAADLQVAHQAMRLAGVEALGERRLDEVSGGEAQRALIAAALAQEPDFMVLDEPTSALDLHHAVHIFDALDEARRQRGLGVVVATHDINLASRYADRLVLLAGGRAVAFGSAAEVLTDAVVRGAYGDGARVLPDPGGGPPLLAPERSSSVAPPPQSTHVPSASPIPAGPTSLRRATRHLGLGLALVLLSLAILPSLGSGSVDLVEALGAGPDGTSLDATVFWRIRLPRVLLGMLAGGALAAAGVAFQALLRNPLATPYTLGVAGGASLGAMLAMKLGFDAVVLGFSPVPLVAFGGAMVSVMGVYGLARAMGRADSVDLLLAGIAWSIVSSACVLLLQYLADPGATFQMVRWMVGGVDVVGYRAVLQVLPFTVLGLVALGWHVHELNLLAVDEELAATRGVAVERTRIVLFAGSSLATAAVISQVGPIGFVGLIVPHAVRALVGPDHRVLLPMSVMIGAVFLGGADALARTILAPNDLPVGVLTALAGGPFLVLVLIRGRRAGR